MTNLDPSQAIAGSFWVSDLQAKWAIFILPIARWEPLNSVQAPYPFILD